MGDAASPSSPPGAATDADVLKAFGDGVLRVARFIVVGFIGGAGLAALFVASLPIFYLGGIAWLILTISMLARQGRRAGGLGILIGAPAGFLVGVLALDLLK